MSKYQPGEEVILVSDEQISGAVMGIVEDDPETLYRVFTTKGQQLCYESQLKSIDISHEMKLIDAEHFHAAITASLIRNPTTASLYSLNSAKIDYIPHQYRPVLKLIRSDRPRLLIADGVGVGKTIEAGLILRELEARRNVNSVMIICPKPLVAERKWEDEMKERFGEDFIALDGKTFRHCLNEMNLDGEWPDRYRRCIIPYSLFDDASVYGDREKNGRKCGLMNVDPLRFDFVIVDEAHHIRNTATYAYRAVDRIVESAEAVVFLTATPVQMEYDDLFVLLNLLRPDLIIDRNTFHEMAEPNEHINAAASIVRAQKAGWQREAEGSLQKACDTSWGKKVFINNPSVKTIFALLENSKITLEQRVQLISGIEEMHTFSNIISRTRRRDIGEFTVRKPSTVTVEFTSEQKMLYDRIMEIIHDILSEVYCTEHTKFMMTTIRRQTASCLFGLVPSLKNILYRHIPELIDDDEFDGRISGNENTVTEIEGRIREILDLANSLPEDDPKVEALIKIIDEKQIEENSKIMVFSSFKHTLNYLEHKLKAKGFRVGLVHGDIPDEERRNLRERFDPSITPNEKIEAIDVMLFSEVGCEGLDYQFCDCMVNYDLPWNPMRVEQRIGRIDRNGQVSESIAIYNMVTPGTVDADIYERCLIRIGVFHNSIGDCEDILGDVTSGIRNIAQNFELTDEERREKLQQLADNKVRYIKEQEALEEKQRDLFGLRIPTSIDSEIEDATNCWLSPKFIQNLVECYLKERLQNSKSYILGGKGTKTLRLSREARSTLIEDFRALDMKRTGSNRPWIKWLESGEQHLAITFDSACWKENPQAVLLSITHPLVKQAAEILREGEKTVSVLEAESNDIEKGTYPFAIYQWKYAGEREDLKLIPVSENASLNLVLLKLLRESRDAKISNNPDSTEWKPVEKAHHEMWENAIKYHKVKTEEMVRYKEASLRSSHNARLVQLNASLVDHKNDKYRQMQEGKIRVATEDYELRMEQLQKALKKADILFDLLSYGKLVIGAQESPNARF